MTSCCDVHGVKAREEQEEDKTVSVAVGFILLNLLN